MNIKEITSQTIWTDYFNSCGSPSFLQSWEWGEVQDGLGYKTVRVGIFEKNECLAIAQIIKIKAKRGNMIFIPHGPIFSVIPNVAEGSLHAPPNRRIGRDDETIKALLDYLKTLAQKENYSFIRIAPILEDNENNRALFKNLGFHISPIYMHAERLWMLDITKDEKTLLSDMRKTTRYSIRRAEKEGVTIMKRNDEKAVDEFLKIYKETAQRENFTPFSKKFLDYEYKAFQKNGNANWFFAYEKGEKLTATALIDYTASTAFYHQGATLHSKVPTSYLLQWESIKEAKKRGCTIYNFWGTLQKGRTPKNWSGLSLFKQGFGGYQVDYVPTQDYIISPKYYLTYLYELYLKWKRGVI